MRRIGGRRKQYSFGLYLKNFPCYLLWRGIFSCEAHLLVFFYFVQFLLFFIFSASTYIIVCVRVGNGASKAVS